MKNQLMLIDKRWYGEYLAARAKLEATGDPARDTTLHDEKSILSLGSDSAVIDIEGPLSLEGPDEWDRYLGHGGASYLEIERAVLDAHRSLPERAEIRLNVNTPGGTLEGLERTAEAIRQVAQYRPVNCTNTGMMTSAGAWLTSGCTSIEAKDRTCLFGSIGAALTITSMSGILERMGIKITSITNRASPDKRPDVDSEEGRGVYIKELDTAYDMFLGTLDSNRKGRLDKNKLEALRGAVVFSEEALSVGLADSIVTPAFGITNQKGDNMKLSELFEKHPELASEVEQLVLDAKAEGKKEELALIKERSDSVQKYLESDAYPTRVKMACAGVIEGTRTLAGVQDLVAMVDEQKEKTKVKDDESQAEVPAVAPAKLTGEKDQMELDAENGLILGIL